MSVRCFRSVWARAAEVAGPLFLACALLLPLPLGQSVHANEIYERPWIGARPLLQAVVAWAHGESSGSAEKLLAEIEAGVRADDGASEAETESEKPVSGDGTS